MKKTALFFVFVCQFLIGLSQKSVDTSKTINELKILRSSLVEKANGLKNSMLEIQGLVDSCRNNLAAVSRELDSLKSIAPEDYQDNIKIKEERIAQLNEKLDAIAQKQTANQEKLDEANLLIKTVDGQINTLSNRSEGQYVLLAQKFKSADSVLVISHGMTSSSTNIIVDTNGKKIKQPGIVSKGKLTRSIIKERVKLNSDQISDLSAILTRRYPPTTLVTMTGCFNPHHAIVIFYKNRISYIDLCFYCMNHETTPDIKDLELRDDKWEKLYEFFKKMGFTYEMGESD